MTALFTVMAVGSSPLTRGKPRTRRASGAPSRLIPTHAGKTSEAVLWLALSRAHPHSRGENRFRIERRHEARGSSPLTRGKRLTVGADLTARRLIPTHAGKTHQRHHFHDRIGAHPHSRGENRAEIAAIQTRAGSSPLTRGKQAVNLGVVCHTGLIPTHAGKTG